MRGKRTASPLLFLIITWLLRVYAASAVVVINTWSFVNATRVAFKTLTDTTQRSSRVLDAITDGCNQCEVEQCDFTVGYGGSPDSNGETTLDAMILDGTTMAMGAVARLRRIKEAIHVARAVMTHSAHSILAGDGALEFAKMMGFEEASLETPYSREMYDQWRQNNCQPNYFRNVQNQNTSCPPYAPLPPPTIKDYEEAELLLMEMHKGGKNENWTGRQHQRDRQQAEALITRNNHDTIGMIVLDENHEMAAGVSSNGANHKIAGRVGDAAVPGAGAYVDGSIGGAAATGDGDIMMRFLPSFYAVQEMGKGIHPRVACEHALERIAKVYPDFKGGMVCLNRMGEYGGAAHRWEFSYSVQTNGMLQPEVIHVSPISPLS